MQIITEQISDLRLTPQFHIVCLTVLQTLFECQPDEYIDQFMVIGGCEELEKLQQSPVDAVADMASDLIEKFFDGEPDERFCDQTDP